MLRAVLRQLPHRGCFANKFVQAIRSDVPEELVIALANAKADALLQRPQLQVGSAGEPSEAITTTLLVTCDQVPPCWQAYSVRTIATLVSYLRSQWLGRWLFIKDESLKNPRM